MTVEEMRKEIEFSKNNSRFQPAVLIIDYPQIIPLQGSKLSYDETFEYFQEMILQGLSIAEEKQNKKIEFKFIDF